MPENFTLLSSVVVTFEQPDCDAIELMRRAIDRLRSSNELTFSQLVFPMVPSSMIRMAYEYSDARRDSVWAVKYHLDYREGYEIEASFDLVNGMLGEMISLRVVWQYWKASREVTLDQSELRELFVLQGAERAAYARTLLANKLRSATTAR